MKFRFLIVVICLGIIANAQTDSILYELNKIKTKNSILRIKDSLREAIVKDELGQIVGAKNKNKELEKYKQELLKIKREDSINVENQRNEINKLREKVVPYPVMFFHKKLFDIYSGIGPFSAKERASDIEKELENIYESKVYFEDSLKIQSSKNYLNVVYMGSVVTSVSQEDALWENVPQDSLVRKYRDIINTHIKENRISHTTENKITSWLMALGIIVAFVVLVKVFSLLFGYFIKRLNNRCVNEGKGLRLRSYEIMSARQMWVNIIRALRWLHFAILVILFGVAINLIFSLFPSTEYIAFTALNWIKIPLNELLNSLYGYLHKLLRIVVILFVSRYIDKLLKFLSLEIQRGVLSIKGFHTEWAVPTYQLLRICLIAFTIIMVFPYLPGADTSAFRGISVFFGVLISLGSSSTIANTIAGFIITYMRPFKLGDWIKMNDVVGEVIEKTALVTRIRTYNNEEITLPNSMILANKTINYSSSEKGLVLSVDVRINYEVPFTTVNYLMIKAALETIGVEKIPRPYVLKTSINETSVTYQLNAYTMQADRMYFITSDLNENILRVFKEDGVDLYSPAFFPLPKK